MQKPIANNPNFTIDEKQNIYYNGMNVLSDISDADRLSLFLLSWYEFGDNFDFGNIKFIKIKSTRRKVPYRAIFEKPVVCLTSGDETYRIVPSYPRYAVSESGVVISILSGKVMSQRSSPYGYSVTSIYDPLSCDYRDVLVHILVANAWVSENQDETHTVVNHIDRDKQNNHFTNLEWSTVGDNVRYSSDAGDYGKEIKCTAIVDGKSRTFANMTDMASYCDIDASSIKTARFNGRKYVNNIPVTFSNRCVVDTEHSQSNSSNQSELEVWCNDVYCIKSSIREVSKYTGISRATITRLVNSDGALMYKGVRVRRKPSTYTPWPEYRDISQNCVISVVDNRSGSTSVYCSIQEASDRMMIPKSTIKRMIKNPKDTDTYRIVKL